jgi:hypothetical protein
LPAFLQRLPGVVRFKTPDAADVDRDPALYSPFLSVAAATAVASAAAWMDIGVAAVPAVPSAPTSVDPDAITKPRASAAIDHPARAAYIADATGPGERQTEQE